MTADRLGYSYLKILASRRVPCQRRQQGFQAQAVVIFVVLVTARQGIDPLPDQVLERVLDGLRIAVIDKLPG